MQVERTDSLPGDIEEDDQKQRNGHGRTGASEGGHHRAGLALLTLAKIIVELVSVSLVVIPVAGSVQFRAFGLSR